MSRTISLFSALVIGAIGPLALHPGTALAVPVAGDLDGDLTGGAADCAPLDPSVHPGAPDRPDLTFTDTNCDGIDGDKAKAIFVSAVDGNDAGTGTQNNPLKTVTAGIDAAAPTGKDVYVAGGTYSGTVNLADDVSVYGSYELGFLNRSAAETTTINGVSGPGALALGDTGVILQLLTLHGTRDLDGNSYGLRAVPEAGTAPSEVLLENVDVTAEAAGAPRHGSSGAAGSAGAGGFGSAGGMGGCGAGVPGSQGAVVGGAGVAGSNGANGTFFVHAGVTWWRQQAQSGAPGAPGAGGRGGQGGTGKEFFGPLCGGVGGPGGRGGAGGSGGTGGTGGGGSFGVYAFNSSVVAVDSTITGGNGGDGGNGGIGGNPGPGVAGGPGAPGECREIVFFGSDCAFPGVQGQSGFQGGWGGNGGGGAGGPSAGVYQGGPTSGYTGLDTVAAPGTAGFGGFQGGSFGGLHGANGVSVPILRTATAPTTSSYDFDADGFTDPVDNCPADAGDSAGCPAAPETSIGSGPTDNGYLLDTQASMGLASSKAGSSFACSLDGGDADTCTSPDVLSGLSAATHVFKAWATDGTGHADPTAAQRTFTVPINNTALTSSTGWTKKTGNGYFRNTYSTSSKQGAALSTRVTDARRVALVATKAPGQGKVNIMLGQTVLKQVNLSSTTTRKKQLFEHDFGSARSGTIKLVIATSGKPVRIEGLAVVTQ